VLTKWLRLTWQEKRRRISDPKTTLHDSVYERFKLPSVLQYELITHYRPEALRTHERLAEYYKDIPAPKEEKGFRGFIKSFFLTT
jgi:hypothetical protein